MDTNQTHDNNYQINTFTKGMNSDTAYDQLDSSQYIFGLNIRITNNTLLTDSFENGLTEQVVSPVPVGKVLCTFDKNYDSVLASGSIGNIGVIVLKTGEHWEVYKLVLSDSSESLTYSLVYRSLDPVYTGVDRFSMVVSKEVEGVIKAYIADGNPNHSVLQLFIENEEIGNDSAIQTYYNGKSEDTLQSGSFFPHNQMFLKLVSGNLRTQQVQYTYRFYKKYGVHSKCAPLSVKLQIISSNRLNDIGNAEDTITNVGVQIKIDCTNASLFDYLLIFRVSYIHPGQLPLIYVIYDDKISTETDDNGTQNDDTDDKQWFTYVDKGSDLSEFSLDEFLALNEQLISPKIIEQLNGYLFYANCTDNTIINMGSGFTPSVSEYGLYSVDFALDGSDTAKTISKENETSSGVSLYDEELGSQASTTAAGYLHDCGIEYSGPLSYDNAITSSMFRSLRSGEEYEYGVVFYNNKGNRSNVFKIGSPTIDGTDITYANRVLYQNHILKTRAYGFFATIQRPNNNIVGFKLVRRDKSYNHRKNLQQVAMSRPMNLAKYKNAKYNSPYYPNVFLSSQFFYTSYYPDENTLGTDPLGNPDNDLWGQLYFDYGSTNVRNGGLYQLFSPEINIKRRDTLQQLSVSDARLNPIYYVYDVLDFTNSTIIQVNSSYTSTLQTQTEIDSRPTVHAITDKVYISFKRTQNSDKSEKISDSVTNKYYNVESTALSGSYVISSMQDVKNPNWEDGFSNVNLISTIKTGTKKYKSYVTNIGEYSYVNWVCNGMYDMPVNSTDHDQQLWHTDYLYAMVFPNVSGADAGSKHTCAYGWIGPGPVCLLATLKDNNGANIKLGDNATADPVFNSHYDHGIQIGTIIADITHTTLDYTYTDPYYSFGPFYEFVGNELTKTAVIFDGDSYMTPAEFTNLFKTYDFNDQTFNLISGQMVYYIPLESTINTYFDYGMNYRNTSSANLTLEPSSIVGVTSATRALHQYNMIYSDNENSIETFFEDPDTNIVTTYGTRIYYSLLKTNGEKLDNWQIVKPADFIDADSKWGNVTNLLSNSTALYFWQEHAFGKLSVNERSLVTDNNGETIQLGQGGVLNRTDYLSTNYGMRAQDFCAVNTDEAIFWIDVINTAILMCNKETVVNYGERLNVQNIINSKFNTSYRPTVHYDLQNNELICRCLTNEQQLIFNTKYNIATSVYTRDYKGMLNVAETLLSINSPDNIYPDSIEDIDGSYVDGYQVFSMIEHGIAIQKSLIDNSTDQIYAASIILGSRSIHLTKNVVTDMPGLFVIEYDDYYLLDFSGIFDYIDYTSSYNSVTLYIESMAGPYASTAVKIVDLLPLLDISKVNKLKYDSSTPFKLLSPTILEFVVNQTPTTTKVFDSQKLTLLKNPFEKSSENLMPNYLDTEVSKYLHDFDDRFSYVFTTDITSSTNKPIYKTDREGNILYDIPRTTISFNNRTNYGNRIRGKWMRERITDNSPSFDHCVSHIITKFRQSHI